LEGESWNTEIHTTTSGLAYIIRCYTNSVIKNLKAIGEGKDSGGVQMGIVQITGADSVRIENNEVTQTPNDAIIGKLVFGNYVHDVNEGIEFGSDALIISNIVENTNLEGMEIQATSGANNIMVIGKVIKNAGTEGIKFYGGGISEDILISENMIVSSQTAIKDITPSATIRRIKIVDNIIEDTTTVRLIFSCSLKNI
jgi:hypothetical protein